MMNQKAQAPPYHPRIFPIPLWPPHKRGPAAFHMPDSGQLPIDNPSCAPVQPAPQPRGCDGAGWWFEEILTDGLPSFDWACHPTPPIPSVSGIVVHGTGLHGPAGERNKTPLCATPFRSWCRSPAPQEPGVVSAFLFLPRFCSYSSLIFCPRPCFRRSEPRRAAGPLAYLRRLGFGGRQLRWDIGGGEDMGQSVPSLFRKASSPVAYFHIAVRLLLSSESWRFCICLLSTNLSPADFLPACLLP